MKGSILNDSHQILIAPGKNSQAARQLRFTNLQDVIEKESIIKTYIIEAIEVERAGLKVEFKKDVESFPEELINVFKEQPGFKKAFHKLTPGRQRGYVIYFSQPKQSKTRISRITKSIQRILEGKGMQDR